jgi:hypothetical protein
MLIENITDLETFKLELAEWIKRQVQTCDISKDGTVDVGSYKHGSLCAYNGVLNYWLGQPGITGFKFVDPTSHKKKETSMTDAEKMALRLQRIKNFGYGSLLPAVKDILGEKATYLKDVDDLSKEDVDEIWNHMTLYSQERNYILNYLAEKLSSANSSVQKDGILRLIRAIDNNT